MNTTYNKQFLINYLIEQTKLNIARLKNLESIVNDIDVRNDIISNILNTTKNYNSLNKLVNGYRFINNNSVDNIIYGGLMSNILSSYYMFYGCRNIKIINLSNVTFDNVIMAKYMFSNLENVEEIYLPNTTFELTVNICNSFSNCQKLTKLNLSSVTFNNIDDCVGLFSFLRNIKELDLPKATFEKTTAIAGLFGGNDKLEKINIPLATFNGVLNNVDNVNTTFTLSNKLNYINMSSATFANTTLEAASKIFSGIQQYCEIIIPRETYERLSQDGGPFNDTTHWSYKNDRVIRTT